MEEVVGKFGGFPVLLVVFFVPAFLLRPTALSRRDRLDYVLSRRGRGRCESSGYFREI